MLFLPPWQEDTGGDPKWRRNGTIRCTSRPWFASSRVTTKPDLKLSLCLMNAGLAD